MTVLQVTEGPDAGKLALLDFGLVAEIPAQDRAAMVSATIHLANRNWSALVDDFIDLEFLPTDANRWAAVSADDVPPSTSHPGYGLLAMWYEYVVTQVLCSEQVVSMRCNKELTLAVVG